MTYGTIKARVSDEMKRGELSISSQAVATSVIDAIRYFENRRFWFNTDVVTVQSIPDAPTLPAIPNIISIDTVKAQISTRLYRLRPMSYLQMETLDASQYSGYPDYFSHYNDNIRLYPPPNATYNIIVSFISKLTDVSLSASASATNEWVVDCESMIRKRAKGELFQNQLRNPQEAASMYAAAENEYRELKRITDGRQAGRVRATKF